MKSEELEVSLRTDFESYLNGILAEMKQEVADFQARIDAEAEKHRSQLNEAFSDFTSRLKSEQSLDPGFRESILEHLRLARDNGAQITAEAFAEAEAMRRRETAELGFADIRDAVNEISSQNSQSAILKSLVRHAERFTGRGAFFIVRNEQFVGWQAFGRESGTADNVIRSVSLPVAANTILGDACRMLGPVVRAFDPSSEDKRFLDELGFGEPAAMMAVPLIARGRGVAVLYVDTAMGGETFNGEAIETLLRTASLTVELLASTQAALPAVTSTWKVPAAEKPAAAAPVEPVREMPAEAVAASDNSDVDAAPAVDAVEADAAVEQVPEVVSTESEIEPEVVEYIAEEESRYQEAAFEANAPAEPVIERFDPTPVNVEANVVAEPPQISRPSFAFESSSGAEFAPTAVPVVEAPIAETVVTTTDASDASATVDAVPSTVGNGTTKFGGRTRSIDLPIEVDESEKPEHVKARRFARLLVSEINLYNEQKVKEGRSSGDLYDRLREAIDRSREMYDQRVKSPVATTFDYFHYELVNNLAEGDASRLGANYPGSKV
ncbi:MAG: GAF domain-containing protein [Pyrinomonadaceae bacterium]